MMRRIRLLVSYDGTAYHGWQMQPGQQTIEGTLQKALKEWLGEEVALTGSSRTDAGVHARGNICTFDTASSVPGDRFVYGLNALLPSDIVIQASREVDPQYHPHRNVVQKTYLYRVYTSQFPNPLLSRYTHHLYGELNLEEMQNAADYLKGEHDFKSFCGPRAQVKSTVRTIFSIKIVKTEEEMQFYVTGNGFLYNMVRILVGTLLQVGRGQRKATEMPAILEGKDRRLAGPTAPAKGLILWEIRENL